MDNATPTPHRPAGIEPLLTVRDVVALSRLGARTVRELTRQGRMPPPIRFGKSLRWSPNAIRAWLANGSPPPRKRGAAKAAAPGKRPVGRPPCRSDTPHDHRDPRLVGWHEQVARPHRTRPPAGGARRRRHGGQRLRLARHDLRRHHRHARGRRRTRLRALPCHRPVPEVRLSALSTTYDPRDIYGPRACLSPQDIPQSCGDPSCPVHERIARRLRIAGVDSEQARAEAFVAPRERVESAN